MINPLIIKEEGLYCKAGEFFIDAWKPVKQCIVTHGHSDHARFGHQNNFSTPNTASIMRHRLGADCPITELPYGQKIKMKDCWVSLHPAGHILGSAQVRIESKGCVCVVSGDYKRAPDLSCEPFELVPCDIFVTESTFGLPIYRWEEPMITAKAIFDWWQKNKDIGYASILFGYALGKAQHLLALLKLFSDEPIYVHGAVLSMTEIYKEQHIPLSPYLPIGEEKKFAGKLILAPPSAQNSPWMKRFYPYKTALASGWMQVRGQRKRRNLDRGFALSDHADWDELIATVKDTGARLTLTTHGNASTLARYLQELKIEAFPLHGTEWMEEGEE